MMNDKNLIVPKSYAFSLQIIELYKFLCDEKKSMFCQSNFYAAGLPYVPMSMKHKPLLVKDFIAKMSIASKEARESRYWLNLLRDSGYINTEKQTVKSLFEEIESINKILTSIVKSGQENAK